MTDPDPGELMRLHAALCAGDPAAPSKLAEMLLPALQRRFRNAVTVDAHEVESLINLCVARYLKEPGRYDPERGPLLAFLYRDVEGDRKNELARLHARRQHEIPSDAIIDIGADLRNPGVEQEVLDALDPFDLPSETVAAALADVAKVSDQDRQLLMLLGDRVRATAAYAEVLGISHLPDGAQRREVKRHKDRLKARLEVIRGRRGST